MDVGGKVTQDAKTEAQRKSKYLIKSVFLYPRNNIKAPIASRTQDHLTERHTNKSLVFLCVSVPL